MKQHEAWLIKAMNDLRSSKKLIEDNEPILDTAIYHTQQCAEKALKGYLAFRNVPIQRTHDIELLLELCCEFDNDFSLLIDSAEKLNPFSTMFRYPDIILEPELEDVLDAIRIAEQILEFVNDKIKLSSDNEKQIL